MLEPPKGLLGDGSIPNKPQGSPPPQTPDVVYGQGDIQKSLPSPTGLLPPDSGAIPLGPKTRRYKEPGPLPSGKDPIELGGETVIPLGPSTYRDMEIVNIPEGRTIAGVQRQIGLFDNIANRVMEDSIKPLTKITYRKIIETASDPNQMKLFDEFITGVLPERALVPSNVSLATIPKNPPIPSERALVQKPHLLPPGQPGKGGELVPRPLGLPEGQPGKGGALVPLPDQSLAPVADRSLTTQPNRALVKTPQPKDPQAPFQPPQVEEAARSKRTHPYEHDFDETIPRDPKAYEKTNQQSIINNDYYRMVKRAPQANKRFGSNYENVTNPQKLNILGQDLVRNVRETGHQMGKHLEGIVKRMPEGQVNPKKIIDIFNSRLSDKSYVGKSSDISEFGEQLGLAARRVPEVAELLKGLESGMDLKELYKHKQNIRKAKLSATANKPILEASEEAIDAIFSKSSEDYLAFSKLYGRYLEKFGEVEKLSGKLGSDKSIFNKFQSPADINDMYNLLEEMNAFDHVGKRVLSDGYTTKGIGQEFLENLQAADFAIAFNRVHNINMDYFPSYFKGVPVGFVEDFLNKRTVKYAYDRSIKGEVSAGRGTDIVRNLKGKTKAGKKRNRVVRNRLRGTAPAAGASAVRSVLTSEDDPTRIGTTTPSSFLDSSLY